MAESLQETYETTLKHYRNLEQNIQNLNETEKEEFAVLPTVLQKMYDNLQRQNPPKSKRTIELEEEFQKEETRLKQSLGSINTNVSDKIHSFVSTNIYEHENYKRLFNVLVDTTMKQIEIPQIYDDSKESTTIVNPVQIHLNIMEILQNYYQSYPNMNEINFSFPQHTITYKPETEISGVFGKKVHASIITVTPDSVSSAPVTPRRGGSRRLRRRASQSRINHHRHTPKLRRFRVGGVYKSRKLYA